MNLPVPFSIYCYIRESVTLLLHYYAEYCHKLFCALDPLVVVFSINRRQMYGC